MINKALNYQGKEPARYTITYDDMLALYDRKYEELMKLSKEELVDMLIGSREEVGMGFY